MSKQKNCKKDKNHNRDKKKRLLASINYLQEKIREHEQSQRYRYSFSLHETLKSQYETLWDSWLNG